MAPEIEVPLSTTAPDIMCACPPSHRRLRLVLSLIVAVLLMAIGVCYLALYLVGGLKS